MGARIAVFAAALMTAVFAGTLAGNAAVAGMNGLGEGYALPAIGDEQSVLASVDDSALVPAAAPAADVPIARADCLDCSDYEAGYRWAAARGIDDATRCAEDSDAFADGCAAYVGDGRSARSGGPSAS